MAKKTNKYAAVAKKAINGCPLMEGRTKGKWDDLEGLELTLEDAYELKGEKGSYYCVTIEAYDDEYFFTPLKLTEAIDSVKEAAAADGVELSEAVAGIVFVVDAPVRTKSGNNFRNVHIM